jgi:23S rRNA (adenine2030-N6)-methyltransferase
VTTVRAALARPPEESMNIPAREKSERPYEHRFHAGNVGDVLKHAVLMAVLDDIEGPRTYVETHAGAGRYRLGPTGEWTEGLGRLLAITGERLPLVERYIGLTRREGKTTLVPGSPLVARACMRDDDRAHLFELVDDVARLLRDAVAGDGRFTVRNADGVHALVHAFPDVEKRGRLIALVDPPWVEKAEWTTVPNALVSAHRAHPGMVSMLWYPVKSHTRPNALLARLEEQALPGMAVELVTAPLAVKKNRLAGSGVVLIGVSPARVSSLAELLGWLGPRLAIHEGFFSSRIVSWGVHRASDAAARNTNDV